MVVGVLLFVAIGLGLFFGWSKLPDSPIRFALLGLLLIPVIIVVSKVVLLKFLIYELTSERIKITRGILSRRTDELELYRVKDSSLVEPFLYRIFSVGNIVVLTNDATTPTIELKGIKNARDVREQLRQSVEECRVRKGAKVMEME